MSIWTEINDELLDYAQAQYNVLLKGVKGIGKTAIIRQVFNYLYGTEGEDWVMLNAATLDPYTQLIGIPFKDEKNEGTIEFLTPSYMGKNLKALFIDEINRAPTMHIQNALLELVQFKSINGKKFPNLQVVWAAYNPVGTSMGVDEILEPLVDRFEIKNFELPFALNDEVLGKKYPFYVAFKDWWNGLKTADASVHSEISPRNLDQMMDHYQRFNNVERLRRVSTVDSLNLATLSENIRKFETKFFLGDLSAKTEDEKYAFWDIDNCHKYVPLLLSDKVLFDDLIQYVNADFVTTEISKETDIGKKIKAKSVRNAYIKSIVDSIEQMQKDKLNACFNAPTAEQNDDPVEIMFSNKQIGCSDEAFLKAAMDSMPSWNENFKKIAKVNPELLNRIVKRLVTLLVNNSALSASVLSIYLQKLEGLTKHFNEQITQFNRLKIKIEKQRMSEILNVADAAMEYSS